MGAGEAAPGTVGPYQSQVQTEMLDSVRHIFLGVCAVVLKISLHSVHSW